jgi:phosphoribosylanthranilate isomerase
MPHVRIKFCGFTRPRDVIAACALDISAIGLNFAKGPRRISIEQGAELARLCPPFITTVALFVDADEAGILTAMLATRCQAVQLHGNEPPELAQRLRKRFPVIKAFAIKDQRSLKEIGDYPADAFLLDAHHDQLAGGTGQAWNVSWLQGVKLAKPVVLAGGLAAANVAEAIKQARPWAVDTASGVEESPGCKDHAQMAAFVDACR